MRGSERLEGSTNHSTGKGLEIEKLTGKDSNGWNVGRPHANHNVEVDLQ
jgi:hypothetical protein